MAEVPFRPARQLSEYKGKGASASREISFSLLSKLSPMVFSNSGLRLRLRCFSTQLASKPQEKFFCPRRVLAQTAKTQGGTLEAPAYREENFAVAGKISIFENTARKGLPKSTQRIAENSLGVNKHYSFLDKFKFIC